MCTFETDNIIGYKKEKEKLNKYAELINEEIKEAYKDPEYTFVYRGLVIWGNNDTGKTLFAETLSNLLAEDVEIFDAKRINKPYKLLDKISRKASKKRVKIILIDDIDFWFTKKEEKYELGCHIADIMDNNPNLFIIATSRLLSSIPHFLRSEEYFYDNLFLKMPNKEDRLLMIESILFELDLDEKNELEETLFISKKELVNYTRGFTFLDIDKDLYSLMAECLETDYICENKFRNLLIDYIADKQEREFNNHFLDLFYTAIGELGRLFYARIYNDDYYTLNISSPAASNGPLFECCNINYSKNSKRIDFYRVFTKSELLLAIKTSLAGYYAQEMITNEETSLSFYYLNTAKRLAKIAIDCGFFGVEGFLNKTDGEDSLSKTKKYKELVDFIILDSLKEVKAELPAYKRYFSLLIDEIINYRFLKAIDVEEIILNYEQDE